VGAVGGGKTLLAEYALNANQIVPLPANIYTRAPLNLQNALNPSTMVTATAPFLFAADNDYGLWVEAECTFTPSANSERYVLALHSGTPASKGDSAYSFRAVTRGTSRNMFVQGIVDVLNLDEMQIVLRVFNTANAAETLTVTAAHVWIYVV
jgi:hypothetical protein